MVWSHVKCPLHLSWWSTDQKATFCSQPAHTPRRGHVTHCSTLSSKHEEEEETCPLTAKKTLEIWLFHKLHWKLWTQTALFFKHHIYGKCGKYHTTDMHCLMFLNGNQQSQKKNLILRCSINSFKYILNLLLKNWCTTASGGDRGFPSQLPHGIYVFTSEWANFNLHLVNTWWTQTPSCCFKSLNTALKHANTPSTHARIGAHTQSADRHADLVVDGKAL